MNDRLRTSAAIQAGGESRRMGQNKALMEFCGQPLIARVAARVCPAADETLVTTQEPELYAFLGLPMFADIFPGKGALGGLYTALAAARGERVLVVGCDMPFVSRAMLLRMLAVMDAEGVDVVIPETENGLEPLHAVYRRETCLPAVEGALAREQRRMIAWFPEVRVRVFRQDEVAAEDPQGWAFLNVNTPEEFAEAQAQALQLDGCSEDTESASEKQGNPHKRSGCV